MSTSYFIFKTDNTTGKTIHICNGSHNSEQECRTHWQCYMYGFMDGMFELLGRDNFQMTNGSRPLSFRIVVDDKKDVEYFMLFDQEGHDLIMELSK